MRSGCLRAALGCVVASAIVGCGGLHPTHVQSDARRVLSAQRGAFGGVEAISAEARVDQRGDKGRIRGRVMMFARRPASVRFDAMSQFGPVSTLTSDGEVFSLASFSDKRFITGPACPQNVARMLRMPMEGAEVVEFLLGGTALIDAERTTIAWDDDGYYRIVLHAADGHRQELDVTLLEADLEAPLEAQRFRLLRSELRGPGGNSRWRVSYDDYQRVEHAGATISWPFRVHVVQKSSDMDTLIRFKEVTVNPSIPEGVFTQVPSGGLVTEEAPCE